MKFSLFVHMERINAQQSHAELYDEMVTLCEMADRGGFHAIWTGEHHGMDFTIAPNPLINIADLARRTKNVRLGTGTVVRAHWGNAVFTNPGSSVVLPVSFRSVPIDSPEGPSVAATTGSGRSPPG